MILTKCLKTKVFKGFWPEKAPKTKLFASKGGPKTLKNPARFARRNAERLGPRWLAQHKPAGRAGAEMGVLPPKQFFSEFWCLALILFTLPNDQIKHLDIITHHHRHQLEVLDLEPFGSAFADVAGYGFALHP